MKELMYPQQVVTFPELILEVITVKLILKFIEVGESENPQNPSCFSRGM
jgi:hypothetical protein